MPLRWTPPFGPYSQLIGPEAAEQAGTSLTLQGLEAASGVLRPLAINTDTDVPQKLWSTEGGNHLVGELSAAEILATPLSKPATPTAAAARICKPTSNGTTLNWGLTISALIWKTREYVSSGHTYKVPASEALTLTVTRVEDVPAGFKVYANLDELTINETADEVYTITGPHFYFDFDDAAGTTNGGPRVTIGFPPTGYESAGDPTFPEFKLPLKDDAGVTYAHLYVADISTPVHAYTDAPTTADYRTIDAAAIVVTFGLQYVDSQVRALRFKVRGADASGRLSVPSDESALLLVEPGCTYTVTLGDLAADHAKRYIYAAGDGDPTFRMLADAGTGTTWTNSDGRGTTDEEMGEYGDWTQFGYASGAAGAASFIKGSVLLDGVGLAAVEAAYEGTALRHEIVRTPRRQLSVWPLDWSTPLHNPGSTPNLLGLVRAEGGVLAFSTTEVFRVWLAAENGPVGYESLGTSYPVAADVRMIARVGGTVFWVAKDGLCASDGGAVRNLTIEKYFSREHWAATYAASGTTLASLGSRLILTKPLGAAGLLLDVAGGQVTACASWLNGLNMQSVDWEGGVKSFAVPQILDWARIEGQVTGTPLTLAVQSRSRTGGGIIHSQATGLVALSGLGPHRGWRPQIYWNPSAEDEIGGLELIERIIHAAPPEGGMLRISAEQNGGQLAQVWVRGAIMRLATFQVSLAKKAAPCYARVCQEDGTQLELLGSAKLSGKIESGEPVGVKRDFTLSDCYRVQLFSDDAGTIPYAGAVEAVTLYFWQAVPAAPGMRLVNPAGGVAPWRYQEYSLGKNMLLAGLEGSASLDTEMWLYLNGSGTAESETPTLAASGAYTPLTTPLQAARLGFSGGDYTVSEIAPDFQTVTEFDGEIAIGAGESFRSRYFKARDRATPALVLLSVNALSAAGWAGTLTITPDYGSAWTYTLDSAGADASWLAIPIPRASQVEGSIFKVDLTLTSALASGLRILMRRRTSFAGTLAGFSGQDGGAQPWSAGGIRWERPAPATAIRVVKKDSTGVTARFYENEGAAARTLALTASGVYAPPAALQSAHALLDAEFVLTSGSTPADHLIESFQVATLAAVPKVVQGDLLEIIGLPGEIQECQMVRYSFGRPATIVAVQAVAETNGTLRLTPDGGATAYSQALASDAWAPANLSDGATPTPHLIPACTTLRVEHVDGSGNPLDFQAIRIWVRAAAAKKLGAGPVYLAGGGDFPPEWVLTDYEFTEPARLASFIPEVTDTTSQTMTMTINGVAHANSPSGLTTAAEAELHANIKAANVRTLRLAFTDSAKLAGLWLFPQEVLEVPLHGLTLPASRRNWLGLAYEFRDAGAFDGYRASLSEYSASTTLALTPSSGQALAATQLTGEDEVRIATALGASRRGTISLARPAGVLVRGLTLFGRVERPVEDGLLLVTADSDPFSWQMIRALAKAPFTPAVVWVLADSYSGITFKAWSGGALKITKTIGGDGPLKLPAVKGQFRWEFSLEFPETVRVSQLAVASGEAALPGAK